MATKNYSVTYYSTSDEVLWLLDLDSNNLNNDNKCQKI